jgi:long-chain acyl-CoA synthetase
MSTEKPWLRFYEEEVPAIVDIPDIPLHQVLVDAATRVPDNTAVHMVLKYLPFGWKIQSQLTYRELDEASSRFAAALHALGIRKGDRVAIMLPNIPQQVIAYFGILKAGGVIVNTNPTYTPRELQYQLADSGARAIIMMSGLYSRLAQVRAQTAIEFVILADLQDTLRWPFRSLVARQLRAKGFVANVPSAPDIHRFGNLLKKHAPRPPKIDYHPEDMILLQYTGGTTGVPRAAILTQHNLVANAHQCKVWFTGSVYGQEKVLAALPLFHVYGMTVGTLLSAILGSELVLVPDPRDVNHILKVIHNEKISMYPAVPAMYAAINNHPKVSQYDLHSVKACVSGGSSLPVEVATQFEKITGGRLVEGYGLSECSPLACGNPVHGERRVGSIGVPVSNTRAVIVSLEPDADGNYKELPPGEEGELVIYGPQVMTGYWNADRDTEVAIDKTGGLHSGDIARMDNDGYFYIVDRKKDLIVASGYNIVPREVEEVLFMYDKVMEAAVAGVPHPKRGETVKAYVVLKPGQTATEEEIRAFCRENLAPYKVPTAVEFRDELPKTQVGKVLRRLLIAEEKAKMAAQAAAETKPGD